MSIITKIRNRSGLAILVVGVALGLFVISDALNSNFGMFGSSANSNNVGEIDGEKIGIRQFEEKLERNLNNFKTRTQQDNIDENTRQQVREQTWNEFLNTYLLNKEYADLGLTVTPEELQDMLFGSNIHPQIKQSFTDPNTGQFDVNNVKRYLKQMSESTDEKVKAQWKEFEDYLVTETLQKKYTNILKKGVYATSLEAKNIYNGRSNNAELNFVALAYNNIADTSITAEESDLKSYFKQNQYKYKERENSRKIEFVVWDFAPTSEDSAAIKNWASDMAGQFATAPNDTLFVDANSDVKFDPTAKPRSSYPEELQDRLFRDSVGSVYGPILKDGKYQIYKIVGSKQDTVFYMRASHILIRVEGATDADTAKARTKANEILARVRKGESFATLATEFGTDGTKDKGGDLGWFAEGQMVKEFNDAVKAGKKGDLMVVKTQFGFHVIKVTEDKSKKLVCAGVVERAIEASEKTTTVAYNDASQFAAASRNEEDFDKNIAERKLNKQTAEYVRETDNYLPGYADAREAIRWAFNAKVGDVSEVITIGNDKYVIAVLKGIREKGKADFNTSRERVLADYRKEKKAEQLTEKMKSALEGASTLDAVSQKLNQAITPVSGQTFENPSIAYVGYDPTFAGIVAGSTQTNKLSGLVTGDAAVYCYVITKINAAPAASDLSQYKSEISSSLQSKLEYGYYDALKEIKGVKDQRYKFY